MKIRVEGFIPTRDFAAHKVHSDHDLYYVFDEEGEMSREEMIKEFQKQYPKFHEDYCRIIKVGEERKID